MSNNLTPPTPSPPCRDRPRQAGQSECFTDERALRDPPAPGLWVCQVQAPAERGPACRNVRDPRGGGLRGRPLSQPWQQRRQEDADRARGQCCTSFQTQDGLSPKPPLLVLPCWGPDGLFAIWCLVRGTCRAFLASHPVPRRAPRRSHCRELPSTSGYRAQHVRQTFVSSEGLAQGWSVLLAAPSWAPRALWGVEPRAAGTRCLLSPGNSGTAVPSPC